MSKLLGKLVEAILGSLLKFFGDRLDRTKADNAQREGAAREVENRTLQGGIDEARAAAEIRDRDMGDAERLDRLRDPARRGQHDQ